MNQDEAQKAQIKTNGTIHLQCIRVHAMHTCFGKYYWLWYQVTITLNSLRNPTLIFSTATHPPFMTAYGRDIRTSGTPKGWLWFSADRWKTKGKPVVFSPKMMRFLSIFFSLTSFWSGQWMLSYDLFAQTPQYLCEQGEATLSWIYQSCLLMNTN